MHSSLKVHPGSMLLSNVKSVPFSVHVKNSRLTLSKRKKKEMLSESFMGESILNALCSERGFFFCKSYVACV